MNWRRVDLRRTCSVSLGDLGRDKVDKVVSFYIFKLIFINCLCNKYVTIVDVNKKRIDFAISDFHFPGRVCKKLKK